MQFIYHASAGEALLEIDSEAFLHLKALRFTTNDEINLRNLNDHLLHSYKIVEMGKRRATLALIGSVNLPKIPAKNMQIAWCIVDTKIIEKTLPFLNELGVGTLFLIWCDKSQRSFRPDQARFERILQASCEQCGRSKPMQIEVLKLEELLAKHSNCVVLDFGGETISAGKIAGKIPIIGAEGGFGATDQTSFRSLEKFSIESPLILRSESAVILSASLQATGG